MCTSSQLFTTILELPGVDEIEKLFSITLDSYWDKHYLFDQPSPHLPKSLGGQSLNLILINTVVPFVFAYGKYWNDDIYTDRALQLLEELPAESNSIVKKWNDLGITSSHAGRTQALLQLKHEYCDQKKCLLCSVGNRIINSLHEPY